MAGWIKVNDAQYEVPEKLNLGEMRELKQIAGVTPTSLNEALESADPDVVAAFVLFAMRRAGKRVTMDYINTLSFDQIEFGSDDEDDAPGEGEASQAAGS